MASMYALFILSNNIPTKIGMNMYGTKFANPMKPNSEYDAPMTFLQKLGV